MKTKILKGAIVLLLLVGLFIVLTTQKPGSDWWVVFRPATQAFLAGENPYDGYRFFSPPWSFLILVPLSLLAPAWGSIILSVLGAVGYLLAFYRLKANPITLIFLITNPGFLAVLLNPNLDWLVLLGYTLPPQIGLFLVLLKPQISAPLVLFWLIESWREGGYQKSIKVFTPITVVAAISTLLYPDWIPTLFDAIPIASNAANVWPFGLITGAVLTMVAIRQRKSNLALIAGPFFSPYLATYSWLPAMAGLLPGIPEIVAAYLAYWAAFLVSNSIIGS